MSDPENRLRVRLRPNEPSPAFTQSIAGVTIESDVPLTSDARPTEPFGVEPDAAESPVVEEIYDGPGWLAGRLERIRASLLATGDTWLELEDGDLYRVSSSTIVRSGPTPRNPDVERLLGPPLAIALARRGIFLLHASALRLADGSVLALTAESGGGKSTLAAAAHGKAGRTRIADDQLAVRLAPSPVALPRFPQLKLRPEQQYPQIEPDTLPFRALVELRLSAQAPRPGLERLDPRAALALLIGATVAARLFDRAQLAAHFEACSQAARQLSAFRLALPRDLDRLGEATALLGTLRD